MIPKKSVSAECPRGGMLSLTPAFLTSSERVLSCAVSHFRTEGGRFVIAEGRTVFARPSEQPEALFGGEGRVFSGSHGKLHVFPAGTMLAKPEPVQAFCTYTEQEGDTVWYFLDAQGLWAMDTTGLHVLEGVTGGSAIAVHHERFFIGKDSTLYYSYPFAPDVWDAEHVGAGNIAFPNEGGKILALISLNERLFVFREHEILRVRADANDLNFRVERVSYDGGDIAPRSVQRCGEYIVFMTERGLAVTDGSKVKHVNAHGARFGAGVQSGATDGKYYVLAEVRGEKCILFYDPASGEMHTIRAEAETLCGSPEGVYYGHGTVIYRLSGHGFHEPNAGSATIAASVRIEKTGGAARVVNAVRVRGKGVFAVALKTEHGNASLTLSAEERVALKRPVGGAVLEVALSSSDAAAEVEGVELIFREDV